MFEAAQYFSSAVEDQLPGNFNNASNFSQKVIGKERQHQGQRAARMSLDSIMRDEITPQDQAKYSYKSKENKIYRQSSSPGGKLASFLNSLFNQTRSKKKRKSQTVGPKYLQEKEIPGERREKRSSISHFRTNTNTKIVDSKSRNFCLSSGFMQSTPTKPCKELKFRDLFERQKRKDGGNVKQNSLRNEFCSEKKCTDDTWIEEINKKSGLNWIDDQYTSEEKEFRKFSDCDDSGDTDSSSDLFELPNCDFEFYSKGLPVYETTRVNSIGRGAPV